MMMLMIVTSPFLPGVPKTATMYQQQNNHHPGVLIEL